MPMTQRIAALHGALWVTDRWYRLSWYVWPASLALLICGWIVVAKPRESNQAAPVSQPAPAKSGQSPPPQPSGPPLAVPNWLPSSWPKPLQDDAALCFSFAIDLNPLIDACTRLIYSGQANTSQLAAAYAKRGDHQRLQQPERALQDYNAALTIQANAPQTLSSRAFLYITRGDLDAAIADLNKAIDILPPKSAGRARYYRGLSHFKRGDHDRAMTDLDEAVKLDPNNADAYLARGEVELAQQKYEAALRDLGTFIVRMPRDARGLIARSSVLEANGRTQGALQDLERALVLEPGNARALEARERLRARQENAGSR